VKCWGNNDYGAIGDASQVSKATPVAPYGTVTASAITAGANYTCILATSPVTVRCWGQNGLGELGNGDGSLNTSYDVFAATPVQWSLPGPLTPTTGTPTPAWTPQPSALSAGGAHTCSIISSHVECWGWNGFGQLGNGGPPPQFLDNTTSWLLQDSDKDGCADSRELNPVTGSQASGGRRDPTNFWDFFDTPDGSNVRDRKVDQADVDRVTARYLATGDPSGDPLAAPPAAPGYSTAFDRTYVGPNNWNLGPPDGQISVADILYVSQQSGHDCR